MLLLVTLASGIPPRYFTDFEISDPESTTLIENIHTFLTSLCAVVPGSMCAEDFNVTVSSE